MRKDQSGKNEWSWAAAEAACTENFSLKSHERREKREREIVCVWESIRPLLNRFVLLTSFLFIFMRTITLSQFETGRTDDCSYHLRAHLSCPRLYLPHIRDYVTICVCRPLRKFIIFGRFINFHHLWIVDGVISMTLAEINQRRKQLPNNRKKRVHWLVGEGYCPANTPISFYNFTIHILRNNYQRIEQIYVFVFFTLFSLRPSNFQKQQKKNDSPAFIFIFLHIIYGIFYRLQKKKTHCTLQ